MMCDFPKYIRGSRRCFTGVGALITVVLHQAAGIRTRCDRLEKLPQICKYIAAFPP
jgi:hypothetical protein